MFPHTAGIDIGSKSHYMQKALTKMNLHLHNVISDITGVTGMAIIRNIVAGITDPKLVSGMEGASIQKK